MEEIMKNSKFLMGILLSSVLLIGSVFAGNALSQDIKDGLIELIFTDNSENQYISFNIHPKI